MTVPEPLDATLLVVAIGLLWKGAEWVVVSASEIAERVGMSELQIGMTVVALGTSAPEMVVTLVAALRGQFDISLGNVVGSNIFNLGLIMGLCALLWRVPTPRHVVRRDLPVLLASTALLVYFLNDNELGRWEGLSMAVFLAAYISYVLQREEETEIPEQPAESSSERHSGPAVKLGPALLAIGLGFVIGGAHLVVVSASNIAASMGLSEWQIGVTIVAAGTSLPELATSVTAAARGRAGLMAGNLIGSDLFNVLGVLGIAALLNPLAVDASAQVGVRLMLFAVVALLVMMLSGHRLSRPEGALLIGFALLRWGRDFLPAFGS